MKMVVVGLMLFLLLLPATVFAKTVVFVSSQSTKIETCADLSGDDKLFCDEIEKLGHTVIVKNENAVVTNAWDAQAKTADLIFLGNVSSDTMNTYEGLYLCNYVFYNSYPSSQSSFRNIPVISTSMNNYNHHIVPPLLGCGVQRMSIVTASAAAMDDNVCEDGSFAKQTDGYITRGLQRIVPAYSKTTPAYIADKTISSFVRTNVWLGEDCIPRGRPNLLYGTYPTLFTIQDFMFFGPSYPQSFTPTMWKIFDRSVLYMLNDYNLSFFTIPQYPTADGKIMVYVPYKNKNTTINATVGGVTKILKYSNVTGLYESGEIVLSSPNNPVLTVETADGLRFANSTINTGEGLLQVSSLGAVRKNSIVVVRASTETPDDIIDIKYKIWAKNLTLLSEGNLAYKDGLFQTDVNISENELLLEVNAANSFGKVGGAYKILSLETKPVAGKDFSISPGEWLLSYANPKTVSENFTISALKMNVSGIKISKSGNISDAISFDISNMSTNIEQNKSATFKATIDLSKISGRAVGKILIETNELSAEIPIDAVVDKAISGSRWLSINPKVWKSAIPQGNEQSKTFNLTSLGQYHANEIRFEATGNFTGLLSSERVPFVKAGYDKDVKLTLNTKSLSGGNHTGKINVFSSIGNDSVDVEIEIVPDFSAEISALRENMTDIENLILYFANRSTDVAIAQQMFADAKSALDDVDAKWSAQDYSGAKAGLESTRQKFELAYLEAKSLQEPFPFLLVGVVVVLIIIGGLVYKFKDKILEKLKKKKMEIPEEEPAEEEKYTPPSDEEGYRPQYY